MSFPILTRDRLVSVKAGSFSSRVEYSAQHCDYVINAGCEISRRPVLSNICFVDCESSRDQGYPHRTFINGDTENKALNYLQVSQYLVNRSRRSLYCLFPQACEDHAASESLQQLKLVKSVAPRMELVRHTQLYCGRKPDL